ncbi:MAG: hypothetical protein K2W99_05365 [Chthoniobacterales bacterium]|nr:hypothetical protein [Chthoniobacterales bacterium]
MQSLPYPPLPTEQEKALEEEIIRKMIFFTPQLLIGGGIFFALLVALCIAYNFNPMQWLE